MIDLELLQRLEERYRIPEVPPCRVCGEEMTVSRMGGGEPTVFHCGSTHATWLGSNGPCAEAKRAGGHETGWGYATACEHYKHWLDSEWKMYRHGDGDVLRLIRYVMEKEGLPSVD